MNAVMAASVAEAIRTGISQSQVQREAELTRGSVATGSGDGYGRRSQPWNGDMNGYRVGEERTATRIQQPPPPPPQDGAQGRGSQQFQGQFHRQFPDTNMMQGE